MNRKSRMSVAILRPSARVLAEYRWYVVAVAAAVAFCLGCVGFVQLWQSQGKAWNYSDVLYWSAKTFSMSSPSDPKLPLALDIARFLAPMVAAYAGLSALGLLFRDRLQQLRIPFMRRHVLVCGLGYVGGVFIRHLRAGGFRVVVIESDPSNPSIELCRRLGVPVVVGDARLPRTLHAAAIRRAVRLVAITPDDAVNAEIVAVARRIGGRRAHNGLNCMARITDPEVCALLRIQETKRTDDTVSMDFVNTDEISARLMLEDFPVEFGSPRPHILVTDIDALGAWVVYHAARNWYRRRIDDSVPLVVTVVDDRADERVASLLDRYPALEHVCRFICVSTSMRDIRAMAASHGSASGTGPPSRAYVTGYRDEQVLEIAMRLRHALDPAVSVVAALSLTHGMARLLGDVRRSGGPDIEVFSALERACTADLVQGGCFESLAHAIHHRWRAEQQARGDPAPPWSKLDEPRRESSRAQARDIAVKLHAVGSDIAPLRDWEALDFTFTADEVEMLATMEHDRWMRERIRAGWALGDNDAARKTTPYLVPFTELPSDIAEYDRQFVREIPELLGSAGMQIVRLARLSRDTDRPLPARSVVPRSETMNGYRPATPGTRSI